MKDNKKNPDQDPAKLDTRLVALIDTGFARGKEKLSPEAQKQLQQKKDSLLSALRSMLKENANELGSVDGASVVKIVAGELNKNKAFLTGDLSADKLKEASRKISSEIKAVLQKEAAKVRDIGKSVVEPSVGAKAKSIEEAAEAKRVAEDKAKQAAEAKSKQASKAGPENARAGAGWEREDELLAKFHDAKTVAGLHEAALICVGSPSVSLETKAQINNRVFPVITQDLGKSMASNEEAAEVGKVQSLVGDIQASRSKGVKATEREDGPSKPKQPMSSLDRMVNSLTQHPSEVLNNPLGSLSPSPTPSKQSGRQQTRASQVSA